MKIRKLNKSLIKVINQKTTKERNFYTKIKNK